MDVLKIAWLSGITLAVILTACSPELPTPEDELPAPPERLIHDPRILESPEARTIILVRLVSVEMLDRARNDIPERATMLVLKSWKGPYSAGRVLHTPKGFMAHIGKPGDFRYYHFQLADQGKEFLIMSLGGISSSDGSDTSDLITVRRSWVWPAAKSQALMAALDQAVRELQGAPHARESAKVPDLPPEGTPERRAWLDKYCGPNTWINAFCMRAIDGSHRPISLEQ